jgi:hypothetical protein
MLPIDFRRVPIEPVEIAIELFSLDLKSRDFLRIADNLHLQFWRSAANHRLFLSWRWVT